MNALAFDTLAFARRMESVGFSREQAEALAEEQAKLLDERLTTKTDLEALRLANKADLERLRVDLAETKAEILKWVISAMGLQAAAIIGAVVAIVKLLH